MVSAAIPSFRLTEEAFIDDLSRIEALGVKVNFNAHIDKTFFEKLRKENEFIYISTGAQRSTPLKIENINAIGVLEPLQFLFDAKADEPTGIGNNVVIIGGGNTAMDAARTAFRLVGNEGKVTIVYRRTKKQMPADIGEIKAVIEEGIEILELASPLMINVTTTSVAGTKHVQSLTCSKMELHAKDSSGRRRPVPIPNSEFILECDTIIPAIGQELDIDFIDKEKLKTNSGTYETQLKNVFIGGDAMRGASTAINAIGDGRKVAEEIIFKSNLKPSNKDINGRIPLDQNKHTINRSRRVKQVQAYEHPLSDRKNFKLVSRTFTIEEAKDEASRCLLCDEFCSICATVCPNLAFHTFKTEPRDYKLQKIFVDDGETEVGTDQYFKIIQPYQILHIADWCNECGNCTTFCPTSGAPYIVKPHLYLDKNTFDKEKDGYYLNQSPEYDIIYLKKGAHSSTLAQLDNHYLYKSDDIAVKLTLDSFKLIELSSGKKDNFELDLKEAVKMSFIMEGAKSFYK